ncbi:MAG: ABC transporter permease [Saprospirales bacterium]|nr:ABC transporter permease [Saprospirales bacterium]MBK8920844.1 ABC transporter permease [Saprospirales bacterium]
MWKNQIKITFRNLQKHRAFTFINIAGLAIGVASCLLILLFVGFEWGFDRWNPNAGRVLRPVAEIKFGGNEFKLAVVGSIVGPDIQQAFPEVQAYCRFRQYGSYLVKRDGDGRQNIREDNALTTDSTFFEVFPVSVLEGDARQCLTAPNSIAISRSRAEKYFGTPQMALGQTLVLDNRERRQVTAVFEDLPPQTHFLADFLLAMTGNEEVKNDSPLWASSNNFQTYFLLRPGTDLKTFESKFIAFSKKKINETAQRMLGADISVLEASGQYVRYHLQPLPSIHLYSDLQVELQPNGSIQHVWIFSAIALFVLLIACINFMNLTTARSAHRAKEIGVRKVLGSPKSALIRQFLSESILLAAFAVVLAVAVSALAMPWFADLTNRPLRMPWGSPALWVSLFAGIGIVGLLAGVYPAFVLSAFDPVRTLKGDSGRQSGNARLRSALVVFQFSTSIALIIATALVYNQLNFIQQKKLGFQKDQVLILDDAYGLGDAVPAYKTEVEKLPAVSAVTVSGFLPVPSNRNDQTFSTVREFREDQSVNMQFWRVDDDYLKTIGLEMAQGRFFDPAQFPSDSSAIILNETAARLFGFGQPLGAKVYSLSGQVSGAPKPEDFIELTVVGVVKDFHFSSLRDNISALSMRLGQSTGLLSIRYQAADTRALLTALEEKWKQMAPGQPFRYRFMDDAFARIYATEQRLGKIAGIFALLSVFVSCLGLFGLATYTAERRTKEIGIRKVLGATTPGIIGLLSKDFLKLVLLSLVFASPLSWYFMHKWLENFAYRIPVQWWIFPLAGLIAVGIAFFTVSFQSIRAALANPVRSLRNE